MKLTADMIREVGREVVKRDQALFEYLTAERFNTQESYDLFISHSYRDKEFISGLRQIFKDAGYTVYVDWIDDSDLDRSNVTVETAKRVKSRIRGCNGLAYIATANTTLSKWCPWELGISDGIHGRASILPVMSGDFDGQEYLGIYPYLDYAKSNAGKNEFWVRSSEDKRQYVVLKDWLKGKAPFFHH